MCYFMLVSICCESCCAAPHQLATCYAWQEQYGLTVRGCKHTYTYQNHSDNTILAQLAGMPCCAVLLCCATHTNGVSRMIAAGHDRLFTQQYRTNTVQMYSCHCQCSVFQSACVADSAGDAVALWLIMHCCSTAAFCADVLLLMLLKLLKSLQGWH